MAFTMNRIPQNSKFTLPSLVGWPEPTRSGPERQLFAQTPCLETSDLDSPRVSVANSDDFPRLEESSSLQEWLVEAAQWAAVQSQRSAPVELQDNQISVDEQNEQGETALMLAASRGLLEACRLLWIWNANPLLANVRGKTVLMYAAYNGHTEVCRFLVAGCGVPINEVDRNGRTALMEAAGAGRLETVNFFVKYEKLPLELTDKLQMTALSYAISGGCIKTLQALLDAGAECRPAGSDWHVLAAGQPRMCFALQAMGLIDANQALLDAAACGDEQSCHLWCAAGAHWGATDGDGNTPLILAVERGHTAVAKILLQFPERAAIQVANHAGETALSLALRSPSKLMYELVCGSNPSPRPRPSSALRDLLRSAVEVADGKVCQALWGEVMSSYAGKQDLLNELLSLAVGRRLAWPVKRDLFERASEAICHFLLAQGADANAEDRHFEGESIWHAAIRTGNVSICQAFLDAGADVEAQDISGRTPLIIAVYGGFEGVCKLLLEGGADVEAKDAHGCTPLVIAVSYGWVGVCRLLLAAQADVEAKDEEGRSVLLIAAEYGHRELYTRLLLAGADITTVTERLESLPDGCGEVLKKFMRTEEP